MSVRSIESMERLDSFIPNQSINKENNNPKVSLTILCGLIYPGSILTKNGEFWGIEPMV